jgi:hypothetical protein
MGLLSTILIYTVLEIHEICGSHCDEDVSGGLLGFTTQKTAIDIQNVLYFFKRIYQHNNII